MANLLFFSALFLPPAALLVAIGLWVTFAFSRAAQWRKRALLATSACIALSALAWFFVVRPFILRGKQVRACADLQAVESWLRQHYEKSGHYPASYLEAIPANYRRGYEADNWGHSFIYLSDGNTYLIASLGKDGKEDANSHLRLPVTLPLYSETNKASSVKSVWNGDQVLSNQGWHKCACK